MSQKRDALLTNMEYSYPLDKKDVKKVYLEAEIDAIEQILAEIKGYPVNGMVRGVVFEERIKELLQQKRSER